MIFVTVGTTDFDALVQRMDELASGLRDPVVCQVGAGAYLPRSCHYFRFAPSLANYIRAARLVVSHGGLGCITEVARLGKALVGVSNLDRRDHHQDEFLNKFEADNHLIWCRSLDELGDAIERASSTTFAPYAEPPCVIHSVIDDFLFAQRPGAVRRRGLWGKVGGPDGWQA
jgi:UDP-N-acetylglucosamine transferase subunit ALG13